MKRFDEPNYQTVVRLYEFATTCSPAGDYIEADSKARLSQPGTRQNFKFSERVFDNKGRACQSVSRRQLAHVTVTAGQTGGQTPVESGRRTPRGSPGPGADTISPSASCRSPRRGLPRLPRGQATVLHVPSRRERGLHPKCQKTQCSSHPCHPRSSRVYQRPAGLRSSSCKGASWF